MGTQDGKASWVELPFWRQVRYYLTCIIIGMILSYILTRFVRLDYLILEFHRQNLWLIIPENFLAWGTLYIWNWSRTSEKRKKQREAQKQLRAIIQEAGAKK